MSVSSRISTFWINIFLAFCSLPDRKTSAVSSAGILRATIAGKCDPAELASNRHTLPTGRRGDRKAIAGPNTCSSWTKLWRRTLAPGWLRQSVCRRGCGMGICKFMRSPCLKCSAGIRANSLPFAPVPAARWGQCSERKNPSMNIEMKSRIYEKSWRRRRDSNPRYGFPHTHFPGVRLQPLGHPSAGVPPWEHASRAI